MMNQGTMVVVTLQIVSGLSTAHAFHGGGDYPSPYSHIVKFFELLALDLFQLFRLDCVTPLGE